MIEQPQWRKSSHSPNGHACVELSSTLDEVRDSKDPDGPTLRGDIATFLRAIKTGRFDRR